MALNYTLPQLLKTLVDQGGSDIHISAFTPPRLRLDGSLLPLELPPLSPQDSMQLCYSVLTEQQKKSLEANKELDFAFTVQNVARFRGNVYLQKGMIAGAFRLIPTKIKTLQEIGLPSVIEEICRMPKGLVLVTGPTGSGKTTSLAAMIDYINETRNDHIITIEDPIEYVHHHKNCVVNQRELGGDTKSFSAALRSALRQDPDVILVGEMRDLETVSAAITAAETGHLVFATLHTNSCVSTLNRIIDVFPSHQQLQIRTQLAMTLVAVMSQMLIPLRKGGRALAMELMRKTRAIEALISEGKFNQIYSAIQSGQEGTEMRTMNQALLALFDRGLVDRDIALSKSSDPTELQEMMQSPRASRSPKPNAPRNKGVA